MKSRKLLFVILALAMVVLGAVPALAQEVDLQSYLDTYMNEQVPQGWGFVKPDAVFGELVENPPFLLDVREPGEIEEKGFIEGAINIPLRSVGENLNLLPADLDAPIVIYCAAGHRGAIAMTALGVLGYTNVRNMSGGFNGWVGADYPVVAAPIPEPVAGEAAEVDAALLETVNAYLASIPQGFGSVNAETLFAEYVENPPFLVDVREPSEWENDGYIDGAINVPLRSLPAMIDQLPEDKDAPVVIYCKAGARGSIAYTLAGMLGYTNVRNLSGGFSGWMSAGYPFVGGMVEEVAESVPPTGTPLDAEALAPIAAEYYAAVPQGFESAAAADFAVLAETAFILDVRELDEYEGGHLAGAVNIPVRTVVENLNLIPMDQPIAVYCAKGLRGAIATTALNMLGYEAINLRGGIRAWIDAELPTTDESTPEVVPGVWPEVNGDLWATLNAYMLNLPAGFNGIAVDAVNLKLIEGETPFILDVREASEFAGGSLPGAVNVPLRELGDNLDLLPSTDTEVIIVDSSGQRSTMALVGLQALGYAQSFSLNGGTAAWVDAGLELVVE